MPKCAFLTMKDLSNFECYDNHLLEPMNKNGWECYFIPWDKAKMDWNYFDLAIYFIHFLNLSACNSILSG